MFLLRGALCRKPNLLSAMESLLRGVVGSVSAQMVRERVRTICTARSVVRTSPRRGCLPSQVPGKITGGGPVRVLRLTGIRSSPVRAVVTPVRPRKLVPPGSSWMAIGSTTILGGVDAREVAIDTTPRPKTVRSVTLLDPTTMSDRRKSSKATGKAIRGGSAVVVACLIRNSREVVVAVRSIVRLRRRVLLDRFGPLLAGIAEEQMVHILPGVMPDEGELRC